MNRTLPQKRSRIGCTMLLVALSASAQQHKWAGRTLDDVEWTIHETLAALPHHGAKDTNGMEGGRDDATGVVQPAGVVQEEYCRGHGDP